MTHLKVIGPDNRACHGGEFDYTNYLPVGGEPGQWLPEREAMMCESGWHWCTPESLMCHWATPFMQVYIAEPSRDVTEPDKKDGKSVSRSGRLLAPYPLPGWWTDAMTFIENELLTVPWWQPQGLPDPAWRVFPTADAAWDAARKAALYAVRDGAWDAARYAARYAAWSAARGAAWRAAWGAARDAASSAAESAGRKAAWDAAWAEVWETTWDTAWDTVWDNKRNTRWGVAGDAAADAALYTMVRYLCADLPLDQRHRDRAEVRWDVWRRGYGLAAEVDGVLYVYKAVR